MTKAQSVTKSAARDSPPNSTQSGFKTARAVVQMQLILVNKQRQYKGLNQTELSRLRMRAAQCSTNETK
jgi:hypothetical protein